MRNPYVSASLAAAVLLLGATTPAAAEHHMRVQAGGDLGFAYDDNVGNAQADEDARDSAVLTGGAHVDLARALSLHTALLLRGTLQGEAYEAESALSHLRLGAMARLSHRPGGGFYTPTLAAWLSAGALEFDSALRDGFEYRAGLHVIEPLTTALVARVSVAAAERRADNAVFDTSQWSAGLNVDWSVLARLTAYFGYQFQDGDIVSTGSLPPKSTHTAEGCGTASACDPDDALEGLFAYRVEGSTHVVTVGANVPLSARLALDAQLRRADASAGENAYERLQGAVSLLLRF
jgi:hypothetical protein